MDRQERFNRSYMAIIRAEDKRDTQFDAARRAEMAAEKITPDTTVRLTEAEKSQAWHYGLDNGLTYEDALARALAAKKAAQ